jgi:hypothetical protein
MIRRTAAGSLERVAMNPRVPALASRQPAKDDLESRNVPVREGENGLRCLIPHGEPQPRMPEEYERLMRERAALEAVRRTKTAGVVSRLAPRRDSTTLLLAPGAAP